MCDNNQKAILNPVLVGLMGSGKSSVGRRLATELELPLLDLDQVIVEHAGYTIPEIFEKHGEAGFRDLESELLQTHLGKPAVLATGGGVVLRESNRALLKQHTPVIWLKTAPEVLARRIHGDKNRPLIAAGNTLQTLKDLAKQRYPLYEACADMVLSRDRLTRRASMQEIMNFLQHSGLLRKC